MEDPDVNMEDLDANMEDSDFRMENSDFMMEGSDLAQHSAAGEQPVEDNGGDTSSQPTLNPQAVSSHLQQASGHDPARSQRVPHIPLPLPSQPSTQPRTQSIFAAISELYGQSPHLPTNPSSQPTLAEAFRANEYATNVGRQGSSTVAENQALADMSGRQYQQPSTYAQNSQFWVERAQNFPRPASLSSGQPIHIHPPNLIGRGGFLRVQDASEPNLDLDLALFGRQPSSQPEQQPLQQQRFPQPFPQRTVQLYQDYNQEQDIMDEQYPLNENEIGPGGNQNMGTLQPPIDFQWQAGHGDTRGHSTSPPPIQQQWAGVGISSGDVWLGSAHPMMYMHPPQVQQDQGGDGRIENRLFHPADNLDGYNQAQNSNQGPNQQDSSENSITRTPSKKTKTKDIFIHDPLGNSPEVRNSIKQVASDPTIHPHLPRQAPWENTTLAQEAAARRREEQIKEAKRRLDSTPPPYSTVPQGLFFRASELIREAEETLNTMASHSQEEQRSADYSAEPIATEEQSGGEGSSSAQAEQQVPLPSYLRRTNELLEKQFGGGGVAKQQGDVSFVDSDQDLLPSSSGPSSIPSSTVFSLQDQVDGQRAQQQRTGLEATVGTYTQGSSVHQRKGGKKKASSTTAPPSSCHVQLQNTVTESGSFGMLVPAHLQSEVLQQQGLDLNAFGKLQPGGGSAPPLVLLRLWHRV